MKPLVLLATPLILAACTQTSTTPPAAIETSAAPGATSAAPRAAAVQPSPQVREAQRQLTTLGLYDGPVDGMWGPGTQSAVQRFQRNRGLAVTARLDDATASAIRDAASTPLALSDRTQVRTVQNRLRQLNFYDGPADGVWGRRTQVALERFQRARNLPVGQVTGQTVSAMGLDPAEFTTPTASAPRMGEPLEPAVVRSVQQQLRQYGFYRGGADGIWGPATQDSLARFQRSRGLEATGTLNPTTASALGLDPNNLSAGAGGARIGQGPTLRR